MNNISYLEILGSIFTLIGVIFAARSSIWNWPLSLIGQFFFFLLFLKNELYGNTILQIYFSVVSLYGWYHWNRKDGKIIKTLSKNRIILSIFVLFLLCLVGGYVLSFYQPQYPYMDATVTICSMVAIIALTHKILEAWYLWIFIDVLSVYLYYMKGLYLVSLEYVFLTGIATAGLIYWKKIYEK